MLTCFLAVWLQSLAMTDLKKPAAWSSGLRYHRGQGLSQYIIGTTAAGHEMPVMVSDLGGNSRVFHSAGKGKQRVTKEVVFHNLGQAFKYFGALIDRVQSSLTPPLQMDEAMKEIEGLTFSPPRTLPAFGAGDDESLEMDLLECEYNEVERESGIKLPPFGRAKEYIVDLHRGILDALDPNMVPSYIT